MEGQSMADFEKEIEESFKNRQRYNDPDSFKWDQFKEYLKDKSVHKVKVLDVVNAGLVTTLDDIRAFIPISQISTSYIDDISIYKAKSLDVVVLEVSYEDKKLILSHKEVMQKEKELSDKVEFDKLKEGDVLKGVIESLKEYGAFVRLSNGLSGLLHISQISTKKIKHPKVVFNLGDEVTVKVIAIKDGKISLSKRVLEEVTEEYEVDENMFDYVETKKATTSFGDLLKDFKFE